VTVAANPFLRVTTFTEGGNSVNVNLISNGDFAGTDLSGEQGNLDGWQTADLGASPGSHGRWLPQSGATSPLSGVAVPSAPGVQFQAMLDEADVAPRTTTDSRDPHEGTHLLYQDVTIPANAASVTVSFSLNIDNSNASVGYTDTTVNSALDFNTTAANQQVRVDVMNPNAAAYAVNADGVGGVPGVYQNLFITAPGQATRQTVPRTIDLSTAGFQGKTIRLRFATTNNRGKLIVGVSGVRVQVQFADTQGPTISNLRIRNPSSMASASLQDPTTDPTIVGTVSDNGSINNVGYIEFDVPATSSKGPGVFRITSTSWDANGNFSFTLPKGALVPGPTTVTVVAVDNPGNLTSQPISFTLQGPSNVGWAAQGPGPTDTTT
jgi:hypothetical protein